MEVSGANRWLLSDLGLNGAPGLYEDKMGGRATSEEANFHSTIQEVQPSCGDGGIRQS